MKSYFISNEGLCNSPGYEVTVQMRFFLRPRISENTTPSRSLWAISSRPVSASGTEVGSETVSISS